MSSAKFMDYKTYPWLTDLNRDKYEIKDESGRDTKLASVIQKYQKYCGWNGNTHSCTLRKTANKKKAANGKCHVHVTSRKVHCEPNVLVASLPKKHKKNVKFVPTVQVLDKKTKRVKELKSISSHRNEARIKLLQRITDLYACVAPGPAAQSRKEIKCSKMSVVEKASIHRDVDSAIANGCIPMLHLHKKDIQRNSESLSLSAIIWIAVLRQLGGYSVRTNLWLILVIQKTKPNQVNEMAAAENYRINPKGD